MDSLHKVITSSHPTERCKIQPPLWIPIQNDSLHKGWLVRRRGWLGGEGVTDLSHQNWLENWGGGVDSAERHSLVCFQTLMRFWQEKRPYPLLSYCHSSDAGPPLGSQSGLQQPSHCHVTVFKANLNMALMVFPHSFWENSMRWGLWWLMNYPFITFLTFRTRHWSCGSCVLTNKCSCLSGAVRDFQLQPREKSKGNMDYITSLFFFLLWVQFFLFQKGTGKETTIYVFAVYVHIWCSNQIFRTCNKIGLLRNKDSCMAMPELGHLLCFWKTDKEWL